MAKKTVVLAYFPNEIAADDAVESLKQWDKADDDVKLNAIGVLVLDDNGKLKTHKMGKRSVGKGAGIGLLLAGVVGGGILGAFHHKNLGLSGDDKARLQSELEGGKAAVGVLVREDQADSVASELANLGGTTETHEVVEETVAEVEEVVPEVEAAEAAAGDDLTIIDGVGAGYADALRAGGVTTFADLAALDQEGIETMLSESGAPLIAGHNAASWPRQAKRAANGDWSALRRYVDSTKVAG